MTRVKRTGCVFNFSEHARWFNLLRAGIVHTKRHITGLTDVDI